MPDFLLKNTAGDFILLDSGDKIIISTSASSGSGNCICRNRTMDKA